jgi:hypothetical protein
MNMSVL